MVEGRGVGGGISFKRKCDVTQTPHIYNVAGREQCVGSGEWMVREPCVESAQ